ncbi:hypothetical protein PF010_g29621 [Phytophthora fragariae]|uniref:Uncharacterized protein n=2 Tax=Phytophthora fragariae TaxID=53985 RepID=A0A6G0MFV0_9STRA|nr:hypothetical protein PF003_g8894 [Phytophthora fragariae]KAE9061934.1 hypothetical protein PF010_g29621 [Phytophthora fragariae]KAE9166673.1 hypothetical protein PF004_g29082 [Phytophthora fragariae]KAE9263830.1 hypothetical protein PF008_g32269 [Phytophthora fragariae]
MQGHAEVVCCQLAEDWATFARDVGGGSTHVRHAASGAPGISSPRPSPREHAALGFAGQLTTELFPNRINAPVISTLWVLSAPHGTVAVGPPKRGQPGQRGL